MKTEKTRNKLEQFKGSLQKIISNRNYQAQSPKHKFAVQHYRDGSENIIEKSATNKISPND